jgi:CRP-like cAMP-binding protein
MNATSIEATPLDLTEEQADFLLDYHCRLEPELKSSVALSAATIIARETVLHGHASVSHKEIVRRTGSCRRTVDNAIKRLKDRNLIERIGTTATGSAIYRATFNMPHDGAAHGLA